MRLHYLSIGLGLAGCFAGAMMAAAHGGGDEFGKPSLFWAAGAEIDATNLDWLDDESGTLVTWDTFAWYGGDDLKLRLEAEGEAVDGKADESELRGYLSWNVADFWDLQAGVRHDFVRDHLTWAAVGVQGLAPYFFETDAHVFLSENGDAALRIEQSIDLAVTQDVFLEPHIEINAYAQDVPELGVGAGLASAELGLQLRYEITREVAPYVDLVYQRALGETSIIARSAGESVEETTLRFGLRLRF